MLSVTGMTTVELFKTKSHVFLDSADSRFEGEDYGSLDACHPNKGPRPHRVWPIHLRDDSLTAASGVRAKAFTSVESAGVRLVLVCAV